MKRDDCTITLQFNDIECIITARHNPTNIAVIDKAYPIVTPAQINLILDELADLVKYATK
jgi:hypothetical protein